MSAFDKVIGYAAFKEELLKVCDMIKNPEIYSRLGAKLPQGVLLEGRPGLGKTLMAECFIEECGVPAFTVRKNKSNGSFVDSITEAFNKAKESAPAIVFLDDMDKFANEDNTHCDAEEYVTIQACIDELKGRNVFVIATVNNSGKLPDSLNRPGRFDINLYFARPEPKDAKAIIEYYLSDKMVSDKINMDDISKMFFYATCADLESIINCAAINAGARRKELIEMEDMVKAVLEERYDVRDVDSECEESEKGITALHEAGHVVICELMEPESVGLVSVKYNGNRNMNGFVHRCKDLKRRPHYVMGALGGKVAVELYHTDRVASGCQRDIDEAVSTIREGIVESGTKGLGFVSSECDALSNLMSNERKREIELLVQAELDDIMRKVRDALNKNREFLEKVHKELCEKETLLASDIQRIKSECEITEVAL